MIKEIYFSSEGRINRWRYFKYNVALSILLFLIIFIAALFILFRYSLSFNTEEIINSMDTFNRAVNLLALVPMYFLNVKRLHDMNKDNTLAIIFSVAYIILNLVDETMPLLPTLAAILASLVSLVLGFYFLLKKGTDGLNQYGRDPLKKY